MRSVLVTGAAGFIGCPLTRSLADQGLELKAVDGFTDYGGVDRKRRAARSLEADVDVVVTPVDLAVDPLAGHFGGVDTVFHLAAQPGVRASWGEGFAGYARDNLIATQRVLEAATEAGVRRVVYASSSSVYGDALSHPTGEDAQPRPVSPYGVTKLSGEHICAAYAAAGGPSVVALRYFTVYGPGQRPDMALHRLFEAAMGGRSFPLYGDGGQIRDLTFVDDVVRATVAAGEARDGAPSPVNIAGGTQITLAELIDRVEGLAGRGVPLQEKPVAVGDVRRTSALVDRAAAVLGWRAEIDVEEGLGLQYEWHRSRSDS